MRRDDGPAVGPPESRHSDSEAAAAGPAPLPPFPPPALAAAADRAKQPPPGPSCAAPLGRAGHLDRRTRTPASIERSAGEPSRPAGWRWLPGATVRPGPIPGPGGRAARPAGRRRTDSNSIWCLSLARARALRLAGRRVIHGVHPNSNQVGPLRDS